MYPLMEWMLSDAAPKAEAFRNQLDTNIIQWHVYVKY